MWEAKRTSPSPARVWPAKSLRKRRQLDLGFKRANFRTARDEAELAAQVAISCPRGHWQAEGRPHRARRSRCCESPWADLPSLAKSLTRAAAAGGRHPPSDRRGMMPRSGRLPDSRRAPGPCPGSQLAASCGSSRAADEAALRRSVPVRRLLTCSAWAGVVALSELALRGAFRVVDQQ